MLLLDNGIRTSLSASGIHFDEALFLTPSLEKQSKKRELIISMYLDRHYQID